MVVRICDQHVPVQVHCHTARKLEACLSSLPVHIAALASWVSRKRADLPVHRHLADAAVVSAFRHYQAAVGVHGEPDDAREHSLWAIKVARLVSSRNHRLYAVGDLVDARIRGHEHVATPVRSNAADLATTVPQRAHFRDGRAALGALPRRHDGTERGDAACWQTQVKSCRVHEGSVLAPLRKLL